MFLLCNTDFAFVYLGSPISLQSDVGRALSSKSSKYDCCHFQRLYWQWQLLFPCVNNINAMFVVWLNIKWVYPGLDKIFQLFFKYLFSKAIWALVSSLWTWLGLSSLFLRYSRSLNSLFWICWLLTQTFKVQGYILTPVILPGPFSNFMYVVSIIILLQIDFHILLLWRVTCSHFMKDSSVSFGSFSMELMQCSPYLA